MRPRRYSETCSIDGCSKPHLSRGFCDTHYRRWQRHGDPSASGRADDWFDPKKKTKDWAAFRDQRNAAKGRGIEWRLSFEEWIFIWEQSGKLHLRGRNSGCYVMARNGDQGAYEVGNVEIISHEENSALPHFGRTPAHQQTKEWRAQHSATIKRWAASPEVRMMLSENGKKGAAVRWKLW